MLNHGGGDARALRQPHPASGRREHLSNVPSIIVMLVLNVIAAAASATPPIARVPVTSLRPLLLAALTNGTARGTLVGEAVPFMTQKFGTTRPIEIDVRTLHPLAQIGCQRLEVTTTQRNVIDPKTARAQDAKLIYQISYCRNGAFPEVRRP